MRNIRNCMNYRLKWIQKGKPLKKVKQTDAIFANIAAVQAETRGAPESLEISMDTKAKVALGDYSRGGKNPDQCGGGSAERLGTPAAGPNESAALGESGTVARLPCTRFSRAW